MKRDNPLIDKRWRLKSAPSLLVMCMLGWILMPPAARADDDVQSLKRQLEVLQRKIEQLEKNQAQQKVTQEQQEQFQKELEAKVQKAEEGVFPANVVTAGDSPGSFKLPGINTSLTIFGFIKGDAIFNSRSAGVNAVADQFFIPGAIPVGPGAGNNEKKQITFHARQSRLGIRTSTPDTPFGAFTTLVEGDFFGTPSNFDETNSNGAAFRLRHAYATLGNLGVGQYWTAFENPEALPDVLDFGGAVGQIFARQAQVRWTQPFRAGSGIKAASWEVSLENPESLIANSFGPIFRGDDDRYPDIVGRVNLSGAWGSFWVAALVRDIRLDAAANALAPGSPAVADHKLGVAGQVGAMVSLATFFPGSGKDDVRLWLNYGNVIGRYQEFGFFPDGILINGRIELANQLSGFAAYRHFWTPVLRSSFVVSASDADNPAGTPGSANASARSFHVNLIWSPIAPVDVGVEYLYGRRQIENGQSGALNRVQFSAKYAF